MHFKVLTPDTSGSSSAFWLLRPIYTNEESNCTCQPHVLQKAWLCAYLSLFTDGTNHVQGNTANGKHSWSTPIAAKWKHNTCELSKLFGYTSHIWVYCNYLATHLGKITAANSTHTLPLMGTAANWRHTTSQTSPAIWIHIFSGGTNYLSLHLFIIYSFKIKSYRCSCTS
jgi:hypothetical protein